MSTSGIITVPFHIGDFLSGTMHMDTLEKGAYLMLILAHYQSGEDGLQDDDKKLSRICGVTLKVWLRIRPIIQEKFYIENGLWRSKKCIEVLRKVHEKSSAQRAKALKRHDSYHATAEPRHCQPKPKPKEDTNVSSPHTPQDKISYDDDFDDFWRGWIPYDMSKGSKAQAKKVYEKSRKETSHEIIIEKRDQYLAECHSHQRRTTHASTWLNPAGNRGWDDEYPEQSVDHPTSPELTNNRGNSKDDRLRDRVNATARQIDDLIGKS